MKTLHSVSLCGVAALLLLSLIGVNQKARCAESPTSPPQKCSNCGCHRGLIPVCHIHCETKKETKYRYYCKCETICIPDGSCCVTGSTSGPCGNSSCSENSCSDTQGDCCGSKCNCLVKDVYKLVKVPYTVETPVRKCTVEWICPQCGSACGCTETCDRTGNSIGISLFRTPAANKTVQRQ